MEQLRFLLYNVTAMKQEQQIHYTANEAAYQVVMPLEIVSSSSGESDDGAKRAEGLTDEVGSIDLTEGQCLPLERICPISLENQVNRMSA